MTAAPYTASFSRNQSPPLVTAPGPGRPSQSVPSSPFVTDKNGEGVAWANSLFEDNAEYGFGMAIAQNNKEARILEIMENHLDGDCHDAFSKYLSAGGDRDKQRACKDEVIAAVKASSDEAVK